MTSPSHFVQRPHNDTRNTSNWLAIKEGLQLRQRRRQRMKQAAVFAFILLVVIGVVWILQSPQHISDVHQPSPPPEQRLVLTDGSSLHMSPGSDVELCRGPSGQDVCVKLHHGSSRFDVAHDPKRAFRVYAGDVSVRVVGTQFTVVNEVDEAGTYAVSVSVSEGVVELTMPHENATAVILRAGDTWSRSGMSRRKANAVAHVLDEREIKPHVGATQPDPNPNSRMPAPDPKSPQDEDTPRNTKKQSPPKKTEKRPDPRAPEKPKELSANVPHATSAQPSKKTEQPTTPKTQPTSPDALKHLWKEARRARQLGDYALEASLYRTIIEQTPPNRSSELAALELGRLLMDALQDPESAIEPLEQVVREARNATFREDALARLAMAYALTGRTEACQNTRQTYLESFVDGAHRTTVERLCPPSF